MLSRTLSLVIVSLSIGLSSAASLAHGQVTQDSATTPAVQAPVAAPAASKAVGMPGASTGTTALPATGGVPATSQQQGAGGTMLPIFLLVAFGIMFIPMIFAGRREAKKKAELIASVKKGDTIQTAGGIIGYVHDINQDDIVLRLEDGRMRVAKSAVVGVLKSSGNKSESVEAKPQGKPVEV